MFQHCSYRGIRFGSIHYPLQTTYFRLVHFTQIELRIVSPPPLPCDSVIGRAVTKRKNRFEPVAKELERLKNVL